MLLVLDVISKILLIGFLSACVFVLAIVIVGLIVWLFGERRTVRRGREITSIRRGMVRW